MENDSAEHSADSGDPGEPTAGEARAVLSALNADATQLAERLVTPWWYHVALGALVALAIGAVSISSVSPAFAIPFFVIAMPSLIHVYTSRYGVSATRPSGPRSRRALLVSLAVLVVLLIAAVLIAKTSLSPWWALLPTSASFGATVMLGRRYDAVLRSEISGSGRRR